MEAIVLIPKGRQVMAHKYDDRYIKGGCAYWQRVSTWSKVQCRRACRHLDKQELTRLQEEYVPIGYDELRSAWWYDVVMW